jgi:hypothetical protein
LIGTCRWNKGWDSLVELSSPPHYDRRTSTNCFFWTRPHLSAPHFICVQMANPSFDAASE